MSQSWRFDPKPYNEWNIILLNIKVMVHVSVVSVDGMSLKPNLPNLKEFAIVHEMKIKLQLGMNYSDIQHYTNFQIKLVPT